MSEVAASPLEAWANYYVIVGSSAAALTGLQFVVLTLIAESGVARGREETISAFGSPNVLHFCAAVLVAAIISAPWHTMLQVGIPIALCGVAGAVYSWIVLRRTLRQGGYRPVLEDWIWHIILPALAYLALLVAGIVVSERATGGLFVIAGATLLLVFVGIHNAWDTVTYVTFERARMEREDDARAAATSPAAGAATAPAALPASPLSGAPIVPASGAPAAPSSAPPSVQS